MGDNHNADVTQAKLVTMAGCSKQFDFFFDGGLQSHTRASLINEVIKHLLYERNQIPLQFDILKQQMAVHAQKSSENGNGKTHNDLQMQQFHCKAKNIISGLDNLSSNILAAFEMCPEIQQTVILLGSTLSTPKECYTIKFPHICPEADNVSLKSSKQTLFRHLVAEQVLSSDAVLGPTNVYVVLCAPRFAGLNLGGFVPKTTFKVPTKGYMLTLNMICNQPSFCSQDLTMDDTEEEISGIEPLEHSTFSDTSLQVVAGSLKSPSSGILSSTESARTIRFRHKSGSETDGETGKIQFLTPLTKSTPKVSSTSLATCDPCHIWFQSSTVIKGYRI